MSAPYYAHSVRNAPESTWQPLDQHLIGVGERASEFATAFGADPLGMVAGRLHDLGKYTAQFQQRLNGGPRVDHATWGARIAAEKFGIPGKLLAYGIAGHHAGLANGREEGERTSLTDRLAAPLHTLDPIWQQQIELPATLSPPDGFRRLKDREYFQYSVLSRMIFSCLVDADYLDTEAFYDQAEGRPNQRHSDAPSLELLRVQLDQYLSTFKPDSDVNRIRAHILSHVRGKADDAPGMFSLTVPTGGGKTLASLAFALDHAIAHAITNGLRRVIYVIPFTSIVEQTAAVFRKALGELGASAVLEHHSAFNDDRRQEPESRDKLRLAMENWDAPIVVTTSVQFFESLYADRPSRCRKLHNIAASVVILDEAQTMPLKLLRPCVAMLDELARNYRASVVLCTATQPALNAPDFVGGLQNVRELAPQPKQLFTDLKRVQVRHIGSVDDEALTAQMVANEQILCIVNNRRHARAVYQSIAAQPGARHLTTLMCAAHRSEVLAEIRQRLHDGLPCRLVATSLIEAGVDVDFPTVLRAEAGLDAIAQAAGRCNREGRRSWNDSEVLVFSSANPDWVPPAELKQFAQAAREILRQPQHQADPLTLPAIEQYFRLLYWQKGTQALDEHNLLGLIERGKLDGLPFETLSRKFRMIDSVQCPVIVDYRGQAAEALAALEHAEGCGKLARELQRYTVQVGRQGFDALYEAGAIQAVAPSKWGEQFMRLVNPALYSEDFGLHWDNPTYNAAENNIW